MPVVAMLQGHQETDEATTRSALAMALRLACGLTGLCALPDPQSAVMLVTTPESTGLTAAATSSILDLQKEMLERAEAAFRAATGPEPGVQCLFVHQVASVEHAAASAATLADALVFPRSAARPGEALSAGFEHVLMQARLPVILTGNDTWKPGPVVIGWDGSDGAARALRFHAPLIHACGEVIIAQNQKDAERDGARPGITPASLEAWLTRRGVRTRTESFEGEVAAGLMGIAEREGAGLILAGAYGHSRLGERLFGGTSRRLLEARQAPALALAR